MVEAGWWWVDESNNTIRLKSKSSGSTIELNIANGGSGYANKETVSIGDGDLKQVTATNSNNAGDIKAKIQSVARGIGASAISINAVAGRMTRSVSKSTTISTLPVARTRLTLHHSNGLGDQYSGYEERPILDNPDEAGPYIAEESVPVPFLFNLKDQVDAALGLRVLL